MIDYVKIAISNIRWEIFTPQFCLSVSAMVAFIWFVGSSYEKYLDNWERCEHQEKLISYFEERVDTITSENETLKNKVRSLMNEINIAELQTSHYVEKYNRFKTELENKIIPNVNMLISMEDREETEPMDRCLYYDLILGAFGQSIQLYRMQKPTKYKKGPSEIFLRDRKERDKFAKKYPNYTYKELDKAMRKYYKNRIEGTEESQKYENEHKIKVANYEKELATYNKYLKILSNIQARNQYDLDIESSSCEESSSTESDVHTPVSHIQ